MSMRVSLRVIVLARHAASMRDRSRDRNATDARFKMTAGAGEPLCPSAPA